MNCVEFIWFIRSAKKKTNWNILHVPLEESLARKPNYNMFSCGAFIDFKHKPWNEWKAHTNTSPSNWFRLFERTNLLWYCGALGTRHAARLNDIQVSLRWMVRHILRSIQSIPRSSHCELNTILFFFFFFVFQLSIIECSITHACLLHFPVATNLFGVLRGAAFYTSNSCKIIIDCQ